MTQWIKGIVRLIVWVLSDLWPPCGANLVKFVRVCFYCIFGFGLVVVSTKFLVVDVLLGHDEIYSKLGMAIMMLTLLPLLVVYHYFMVKYAMGIPKSIVDYFMGQTQKIIREADLYQDIDLIALYELLNSNCDNELKCIIAEELNKRDLVSEAEVKNATSLFTLCGMQYGMQTAYMSDRFIICGGTNSKDTVLIKLADIINVRVERKQSAKLKAQKAFEIEFKNKVFKEKISIVPHCLAEWRDALERNHVTVDDSQSMQEP